jgi:hypothetical protein
VPTDLRAHRGHVARKVLSVVPLRAAARHAARISSRAADRLQNVPINGQFSVRIDRGTSFRYLASPSDAVGRILYWGDLHRWEVKTWSSFVRFAADARCSVDIGAFTGVYTLAACSLDSQLRCCVFEPVDEVYAPLCANVSLNCWRHRVTAVNAAVSRASGTEEFWLADRGFPDTGHLGSSPRAERERSVGGGSDDSAFRGPA